MKQHQDSRAAREGRGDRCFELTEIRDLVPGNPCIFTLGEFLVVLTFGHVSLASVTSRECGAAF